MQKKRKKYQNKFVAPIRYFLRTQTPKENDFFRLDIYMRMNLENISMDFQ